ncbi:hypothetical protein GMES_2620 [Paraglaciecola mesophila KMM 241]|uniref:Uncharacterized protein n=1 Tax=Paraglaciecola mesophila KMM 241 TaxID=1128912 RepID=K6ZNJ3_9ALTE|nr:hypothetical protein GMES_2620 [Paraglaciecola mesophila KMM 241]
MFSNCKAAIRCRLTKKRQILVKENFPTVDNISERASSDDLFNESSY